MDPVRRAGVVRDRLPVLRPLHRPPGPRGRRHARDAGRAAGERPGLRRHRPPGPLRAPLRGDRRRRTAGRPGARRADGLPAGHDLDHRRRHPRRSRAGHDGALLLDAPRRQEPGPDGPRGDRRGRRHGRPGRRLRDHDHHPGGPRARRGQRARGVAVGRLLDRADDPDRPLHGLLPALPAPGPRQRDDGDRRRPPPAGDHRGRLDRRHRAGRGAHAVPRDADDLPDRLRLRRLGAAGVDAADPARLPLDLHEGRRDPAAGGRPGARAPGPRQRGRHLLRARRRRAGLRRQALPVRVHHDRVRCAVGLPRPDLLGHDPEDDRQGEPRPDDRLRRHADGVLRRDQRPHRGLRHRPGPLLRDEQPGRRDWRHRRQRGRVRRDARLHGLPRRAHPGRGGGAGADARSPARAAPRPWPSASRRSSPTPSAGAWPRSGTTSRSCSRRCSS